MSFRSSEGSQHRDAEAAVSKVLAYLVANGTGGYQLSTTGPATAHLSANGTGGVKIDAAATEHASGFRLLRVGNSYRIFK